MKAGHQFFGAAAILGLLGGASFVACAEGTEFPDTRAATGSGGGSTGSGSTLPEGEIGGPCETQEDCVEGTCTVVGAGKICTVACPPACPQGTYCAIIEGDAICVPDLDQQCTQCTGSIDCKSPSDECLKSPLGDKFCAIDCTTMGTCPNGFTCVVGTEYTFSGSSGSGGGGPADADAGDDAGTDGGADAGKPPPSGVPYKFCVPNSGNSCPCSAKRDGVTHTCSIENASGACSGTETCDGEKGKWEGCTAAVPKPEACNAKDDNCNGESDEGDPNALCATEGPPPPHAGWGCAGGMCSVGACEPGFAAYPPGPEENGCACPMDAGEPNDTCGAATNAGSVSDVGAPVLLNGTLSSDTDVDVWMVNTVDSAEVNTNSYHVSIDFAAPAPNDEFMIDVIRGGACSDSPGGPASAITAYDWCVNGSFAGPGGQEGEAPCSPTSPVHCNNNSAVYYIRVYRRAGATGTCSQYSLSVTAKGSDACDFAVKCQ